MSSQLKGCKSGLGYTALFFSVRLKVSLPCMEIIYLLPVMAEEAKAMANIQCLLYSDNQKRRNLKIKKTGLEVYSRLFYNLLLNFIIK